MLDGFLTTALEIIIILDVCGAVVYVLAVSLRRASQKQAEQPELAPSTPGFTYSPTLSPAFAGPPLPASPAPPRVGPGSGKSPRRTRSAPPCRRNGRTRSTTARPGRQPSRKPGNRRDCVRESQRTTRPRRRPQTKHLETDGNDALEEKTGSGKAGTNRYRQ